MKVVAICLCALALATPAFAVGEIKGADPAEKETAAAVSFAVKSINQRDNSMFAQVLSSVVEAKSQVVAGIKYSFVLETVRSTSCRNDGSAHTLCSCPVDESQKYSYKVDVLSQPWSDPPMQVLSVETTSVLSENSIDGGLRKSVTIGSAISSTSQGFQSFLSTHGPAYCDNAAEITKRSQIFEANMRRAKKMQEMEKGTAKYGATKFADLTEDEFRQQYAQTEYMQPDPTLKQAPPVKVEDAPTSFDWRQHNAVTEVKNQGSCGSCWAFSTTGNVEGQWAIKKGKLVSLSEQELVDCDKVDHGCKGGLPSQAYKQIMDMGGLTTEAQYPYHGARGTCQFKPSEEAVNINGSLALPQDEAKLAAWLAANGPISIGINAAPMQFYMGGISHPWKLFCNPEKLDHGVLIVGYGVHGESAEPYWIIKNSWGPSWGEKGYYLVYRGSGVCGLNRMATSSIVA